MFGQIDTMQMARGMARHAAARTRITAQNVANADSPGYRARDVKGFAEVLGNAPALGLRATDARHVAAGAWGSAAPAARDAGGEPAPNGNTVSLEDEMIRAADAKREFDLAVTVLQTGMALTRTALGRRG